MERGVPPPSFSSNAEDPVISELREKHKLDLENLTLSKNPFRTLQLFLLAMVLYLKRLFLYAPRKGGWFNVLTILVVVFGLQLLVIDAPHEKHVQESLNYVGYGLWWVGLGVASSIGLGSGLHTFVLYLGPHIALFTIKAVQCGRVDLKTALYDTIQLKRSPSWLEKDCSEFGPPVYPPPASSIVRIPLSKLLPQVQIEAMLWGIGTALGELPPYFISRAASLSGSKLEIVEELDGASSQGDGLVSSILSKIKCWLLSHSQHLNVLTILLLASVPNPLFDLAGIMCGQFGVPFWKFFIATLIGKAIIKTHIQTVFIISLCNNQLLEWVENELIWLLGHIPAFSSILPTLIVKLNLAKEKFLVPPAEGSDSVTGQGKEWNLSFGLIWNTVVWVVLMSFFVKIVTETAQRYLKKQQDVELANKLSSLKHSSSNSNSEMMVK